MMIKNKRETVICFGCKKEISVKESIEYDALCKECYKKANG